MFLKLPFVTFADDKAGEDPLRQVGSHVCTRMQSDLSSEKQKQHKKGKSKTKAKKALMGMCDM